MATRDAGSASVLSAANPRAQALACQLAGIHSGQAAPPSPGARATSHATDAGADAGVSTSAIAVVSIIGMTSHNGAGKGLS